MSSASAPKNEEGWTVVGPKKTPKPATAPTAEQQAAEQQRKLNRLTGFRPIPERELRNLPREVRIAHADDQLAREKRYYQAVKEEKERAALEKEDRAELQKENRHKEWRQREENRQRRWRQECLQNGSCLTCGEFDHRADICDSVEAEPAW